MSDSQVSLKIEGYQVSVPEGTLLVNAAKMAGVYVPVFCYHPKMDPVGMCRMCLVEIGRPKKDRETGDFVRDETGEPVIEFGQKLETACTTPVGEGWVVRTASDKALEGQKEIIEFLLTSHPLDCPVCDKGGECPLQELTMDFGSGKSRFLFEDKMQLGKRVPLGELIYLDQERCIQCARCTRFQDELVDDPVIGFEERGRRLQIVTYSEPGFDSYFSGNTTDVCPVGALTTADFRFEARPWELKASASVCSHCPVGCNTTVNTRRQPDAQGRVTVQRVLPRQNEAVNEIWMCDKGRFAHHYADSLERLERPLVRDNEGELVEAGWEEALDRVAEGFEEAGENLVGLAGGRVSNEDLFTFRRAVEGIGGRAVLIDDMGGGELIQDFGVARGTNLGELGEGDAILVVASDLHEEAPIWWLRVKQAVERGAKLVVANGRETRLDKFAAHTLRYDYAHAVNTALGLLAAVSGDDELSVYVDAELRSAAGRLKEADRCVAFYGREGLDCAGSEALARACARLLVETDHVGAPGNGLVAVWPRANTQGAWDMGLRPEPEGLGAALEGRSAAWLMAADPAGDDPQWAEALGTLDFLVVQDLYLTASAERADVVLPVQSYLEREGTFTSGERRVQRFYPVLPPPGDSRPDWKVAAQIGARLDVELEVRAPALVLGGIGEAVEDYAGLTYQDLAQIERQWPPVGGEDLYFGGTAYSNRQGLGVQLAPKVERGEAPEVEWAAPLEAAREEGLTLVPVTRLYDRGRTVAMSEVLRPRLQERRVELNPEDLDRLSLEEGQRVELRVNGYVTELPVSAQRYVPAGSALVARSMDVAVHRPAPVEIKAVEG